MNKLKLFKYIISDDEFAAKHTYFVAAENISDIVNGFKFIDDAKLMKERNGNITYPSEVAIKDLLDAVNVEDVDNRVIRDYSNIELN